MKNNLLLIIIFITSILNSTTAQKCLVEGIKFDTQKQIDNFSITHSGCSEIIGDVLIESDNAITNLDGLSQIVSIGGHLKIQKNGYLDNLYGLKNLNFIGGSLDIILNNSLTNLRGLENLSSINGQLKVSYNPLLINLDGLDNITSVYNSLSIRSNNTLLSLNGLEKLDSVRGNFGIISNDLIPNLIGLNNLTFIGKSLSINSNDLLTSLDGLENLNYVGGRYDIYNNILLTDYTELNGLLSVVELKDLKAKARAESKERKITKRNKIYKVWITEIDKSTRMGYLREIKDSSMVFSNYLNKSHSNYISKNFDVRDIQTIKYKSPNKSIGKSMLIGGLLGFAVGAVVGGIAEGDFRSHSDDPFSQGVNNSIPTGFVAIAYGAVGSIPGILIGAIVGSIKIEIPIKGNQNQYNAQKYELMKLKTF